MGWLNGKKTYIASILSVLAAWAGVWAGSVTVETAIQITQVSVIGSTLRNAL